MRSRHPNRKAFDGVLTIVDRASDKPPSGARGHLVVLPKSVALAALPSLIGMAIDLAPGWDGHDARRKIGVMTHATIRGVELQVRGYVFVKDFPELLAAPKDLGMSYEIADTTIANMFADVWTLTKTTFTGAAVLLRKKAAYEKTRFTLTEDK